MRTHLRALAAESIGTFALVLVGCGAIMVDAEFGGLGAVGVALAFGLVIAAMIYAFGHVSGAHFNPAVTLGLALTRRFPARRLPSYWVAQVVGALVAALVLRISLGDIASLGATMPTGSQAQSFAWEAVLTALLLLVIAAVALAEDAQLQLAGIAVGGTIAFASLVGGPISGASLNPARSLGPAVVSGETASLWIYLVAPCLGAIVGVVAYACTHGFPGAGSPEDRHDPDTRTS